MADIKLPFIAWREGRPRFVPGARERELGFVGQDLKHDDGRWYSLDDARVWAAARHAEIVARRAGGRKIAPKVARGTTLADLLADWQRSKQFQSLKAASQRSYVKCVDAILYRPQERSDAAMLRKRVAAADVLGVAPPQREREPISLVSPAAIGAPELRALFDYACDARGHHMAIAIISTVSAALTWGRESTTWRLGANPRLGMQFERPAGRVVLITLEAFRALVAAADASGRPSIGDSLYLGLWTGQRQTDRLLLRDEGLDADGRRAFKQSKTGALVAIKEAPELAARLDAARKRVAAIKLKLGTRPDTIIVDETTGLPYNDNTYRHCFDDVRAIALRTCPAIAVEIEGGTTLVRDQDLRDTCVTLLDRAGVDILSVCDITGHSYGSVQTIIKHYRARNPHRADAAIDRLVAFVARGGA